MNMVGVTNLRIEDPIEYRWFIKVKCTGCGEIPQVWQYVVIEELVPIPESKSEAHLVEKCNFCNRVNYLCIVPSTMNNYKIEKNREFQQVVIFESRGMEPVEFDLRSGWTVDSVHSPVVFQDIDLEDRAWADYDDREHIPVEINEIEYRFTPTTMGKKKKR
ncbi:unnamed protein product [Auanema sp. JU1783]|nr:unnamed protein product [Auanema sp. JU1783]